MKSKELLTQRQSKLLSFMKKKYYHVIIDHWMKGLNCQGERVFKMDFNKLLKLKLIRFRDGDLIRKYYCINKK